VGWLWLGQDGYEGRALMAAGGSIIDCDVHIHEHPPDLAPYIEQPWRRSLETMQVNERWLDVPGYSPLTALDPLLGDFPGPPPHLVTTPEGLRADLDRRGVAAALLFTGQWAGIASTQDEPFATALMQAHNRYLRERWADPARGLYAPVMAVPQNPAAAAAEIDAYASVAGVAAVWLPAGSMWPLWGHRRYDPIMAAAEAADLPVVLQGPTVVGSLFPYQLSNYDTALAKQALAQPLGAITTLVNLVTTGVLARFPRLKVVFTEAGLGWLPFVMWRLDLQYADLRTEVPFLTLRPSEYIRRNVYVTTHRLEQPDDPAALAACIAALGGPGRVLFASNWPHYNADDPAVIDRLLLSAADRRRILGENARAVLKGVLGD
jgi:predicted TIM-barrel fold metal-dependent hydrolase